MPRYRPEIDGIRAVAVLAVLGFHAAPGRLPGGFLGVDVFFVISGFLITRLVLSELEEGSFSLGGFYTRRILRLFPALLLTLIGTMALGWTTLFPDELRQTAGHAGAAGVFATNVLLYGEGGYFDAGGAVKPLHHLWSLAVEEQFYLLWPGVLLWWRVRGRSPVALLAGLAATSLVADVYLRSSEPRAAFYLPFARIWELCAGGLLATAKAQGGPPRAVANLLASAGLLGILAAVLTPGVEASQGLAQIATSVVGAFLLLFAGPHAWINRALLSHRALVWIGLVSYPLYLFHWPLLSFARILYAEVPPGHVRVLLLLVAFGLASLVFVRVERPIRAKRSGAVAGGLVFASVAVSIASGALAMSGAPGRLSPGLQVTAADITRSRWGGAAPGRPCSSSNESDDRSWCRLSGEGPPSSALWGDSHAQHLFAGLADRDKRGWLLIGRSNCPPVLGLDIELRGAGCLAHNEEALARIQREPSIRTVVLSFVPGYPDRRFYDRDSFFPGARMARFSGPSQSVPERIAAFADALGRTVTALRASGRTVVIFGGTPFLPADPRSCLRTELTRLARSVDCRVLRSNVEQRLASHQDVIRRVSRDRGGVLYFDPVPVLCGPETCPFRVEDMSLFRDSNHLSVRGSIHLADRFLPWLHKSPAKRTEVAASSPRGVRERRVPARPSLGGTKRRSRRFPSSVGRNSRPSWP